MACIQTLSGLVRDCAANVGGIKAVYIANIDDVQEVTLTSDIISAITMAQGKKFKGYYFKRGQASMNSTPAFNDAGDYAGEDTVLSLTFLRQDATKRLEMAALSVGELAVIVQDNNGNYWYLGYDNPVLRTGGESPSGAAATDTNAYGIELTDRANQLPYSIEDTAVAAVID